MVEEVQEEPSKKTPGQSSLNPVRLSRYPQVWIVIPNDAGDLTGHRFTVAPGDGHTFDLRSPETAKEHPNGSCHRR
jgi:hypothetical protein